MASTIQLKTGTGSAVPTSLTQGEIGINIDNGLIYYGSGSGNDVKQLESFTHITASGDISASGNINLGPGANYIGGKRFITSDDGFEFRDGTVKALGGIIGKHITASKNISASGTIITNEITASSIHLLGDNKSITFDNGTKIIGDHSIDGFQIRTQDAVPIVFKTNGNNIRATIAADGEATFAGVLNSTKVNTGQGDTEVHLMDQNIRTSDNVEFVNITATGNTVLGNASTDTHTITGNITASGTVSASAFVGTPIIIHEWAGYLGSFTPDRYYYGHTLYGPTHHLWNGNVSSEPSNMNDLGSARHGLYFHYLPCNITNIGIRGGGQSTDTATDTIQFHLYKTTPQNNTAASNSTLTKIGVAETDNISNTNRNYTANLTTNESASAGEALVILMRPTGTSAAIRWNYTIFGYSNG